MDERDEALRLFAIVLGLETILAGLRRGRSAPTAQVFRVVDSGARPSGALKYYACVPVGLAGIEGEGQPAVYTVGIAVTPVAVLAGTPPVGANILARVVPGGRWVASRSGAGSPRDGYATLPGCACTLIPPSLHLAASGPCGEETFPTCDFLYGPTPTELTGLDLGPNCFLSVQVFDDLYSGATYRLHLGCDSVFVRLSRVYLPSSQGGASHDATLYAWSIGQPGNTCDPFALTIGFIYPGGNPRCVVTVTQTA